ncbi:collagen-like protein [Epibacterium sp. MM17-32]|uniref:collagen-like triple helix repeat-containing protein n=1 Tax=Epibacterium sp. MM17-32 TaxID=2917734 RepID=UPI001EF6EAA1|nr:collagen-like protein [Epibacterium sp. MM17-32]MCG7626487.1 collagen-like protein [Epibacterium sp. MM17-32]
MSQLILVGPRGPQGIPGDDGQDGAPGAPGADGHNFGSGNAISTYAANADHVGDIYYHDNGNVYRVDAVDTYTIIGEWQGQTGDKGDKGDPGNDGSPGLVSRPSSYGASEVGTPASNDTAFANMAAAVGVGLVDLEGKSWPVTAVPNLPGARNGFWRVTNFDGTATVDLPAPGTIDRRSVIIEGGRTALGWPQGTPNAYNGVAHVGYMAATGHDPGSMDWSEVVLTEKGRNAARFRSGQELGMTGEIEVFGATILPPVDATEGPKRVALASDGTILNFLYRDLPEYSQDTAGGALVQAEAAWQVATFGGASLGARLRTTVNSAYSVTTSGLPTLVTSPSVYGSNDGENGNVYFGFHGLTGFARPCIGFANGTPKDGDGTIAWVGNIGNLNAGVEPSVCWYKNGGSSRLCGFIRSQGSSYPIRFWSIDEAGIDQARIESAAIQDCPFGNDFATYSPINCKMRPRRKGVVSGWLPTWETIDGDQTDELHFVFTGRRTIDGGPGDVWLYWGRVARGSGHFDNIWDRAQIIPIKRLYFANSNINDTSNQVGTPDLCWIDANTLLLTFTNERPAVAADYDESYLECMTISLRDTYADAADRVLWDDGAEAMADVVKAPEFVAY